MWTRESIKDYAKDFLRNHYWKAFVVCLIVTIIGINGNNSDSNRRKIYKKDYPNHTIINSLENKTEIKSKNPIVNFMVKGVKRSPIFFVSKGMFSIMFFLFIILMITVGYAIEVGKNRFFLRGFKGDVNVGNLFSTFNSNEYIGIVKTQFIRSLYNFLWSLLFVIPGIIKSYEYRMVPYILTDHPNLPSDDVIQRSRDMTYGHKMDMFVLDLSFLGWYFLGLIFFGIGGIFVDPYKEATMARLYNVLSGEDSIDGKILI